MFTGIIQGVGTVVTTEPSNHGLKLGIDISSLDQHNIQLGDSIAVNGACLTLAAWDSATGQFDLSSETRSRCLVDSWAEGFRVNLESALTLQTPIGGHLVSGHVDGIAELVAIRPDQEYSLLRFVVDTTFSRYLAGKGSVALDGVSLTINNVADMGQQTEFDVMLVPHTLSHTTLGDLEPGSKVHLEVDQVARYVDRILQGTQHG